MHSAGSAHRDRRCSSRAGMGHGLPDVLIPLNCVLVESARRDIATLDRCGGDPALDFAHTLRGLRDGPGDDEGLHGYDDLVAWASHAGLLEARDAERFSARAAAHPRAARDAFAGALALREQVYRVMAALADGTPAPAADLDALRAVHREALGHGRLVRDGPAFAWRYDGEDGDLRRPLWPVAQAAVDLLRSEERVARL